MPWRPASVCSRLSTRTDRQVPAPLLAVLSIVLIQLGAAVAKGLFAEVGASGAVFLRAVFAATALGLLSWRRLGRVTPGSLPVAGALGAALGGMNLCFYASLERVPLGIAVTLECLGPLGLAIVGSRRRLDLLWAVLAIGGVVLLTRVGSGEIDPLGVLFGLGAGVLWAAYIVLSARTGALFQGGEGLSVAMVVAALLLAPAGLLSAGTRLLDVRVLGLGLLVALLSSAIPYSLEMESLRRLPPRTFGVLMSLEPALGVVVGAVALREAFGLREVTAIGLVVAASLGTSLAKPAPKPALTPQPPLPAAGEGEAGGCR